MAHYTLNFQLSPLYTIQQDILQDPQTQNMNMPDGYAPDMNANEWYLSDAETLATFQYTNTGSNEYQPSLDVPGFVAEAQDQPPSAADNATTLTNDSAAQILDAMDPDTRRNLQRDLGCMIEGLSRVGDWFFYNDELIDFDDDEWFKKRGLSLSAGILQPDIERFYQNRVNGLVAQVGQLSVQAAGVCDPSVPITSEHTYAQGGAPATDGTTIPYGLPTPGPVLDAIPDTYSSANLEATVDSTQEAATAPVYHFPETIVIPEAENIAPEQCHAVVEQSHVAEQSLAALDDRRAAFDPSHRPTKRVKLDAVVESSSASSKTTVNTTAHHSSRRQPQSNTRRARKPLQPLRQNGAAPASSNAADPPPLDAVAPAPPHAAGPDPLNATGLVDTAEPTPINATEPTPINPTTQQPIPNSGLVHGWTGQTFPLNPAVVAQAYAPLPAEAYAAPMQMQNFPPAGAQPQDLTYPPNFFPQVPYLGYPMYGGYTYGFAPAPVPDNFAPVPVYEGAPMTAYNGLYMDAYGNAYMPQMDACAHQPFTYAGQPIAYDNQPVVSTTNTQLPTPPSTMYSSSNDSSSSLNSNASASASSGASSSNSPSSGSSSSGSSPSNSSRSRSHSSSSTSATSSSASPAPTDADTSGFKEGALERIFGSIGRTECRWAGCAGDHDDDSASSPGSSSSSSTCTTTFTPHDAAHAHTIMLPHIFGHHGARTKPLPEDSRRAQNRKSAEAYMCQWMVKDLEAGLDADGNPQMRICGAPAGSRSDTKSLSRHIAETHLGRSRNVGRARNGANPTTTRARKARRPPPRVKGLIPRKGLDED